MKDYTISIDELAYLSRAADKYGARLAFKYAWIVFYECGHVAIITTDTHRMHVVNLESGELAYPNAVKRSTPFDASLVLKYAKLHKASDVLLLVGDDASSVNVVYRSKHGEKREPAPIVENPGTPSAFHRVVPTYQVIAGMRCEFAMNPRYVMDAQVTKGMAVSFRGESATRPFILSEHKWAGTPWAVRTFAVVMPYFKPVTHKEAI